MNVYEQICGIDVSKANLDISHLLLPDNTLSKRQMITNTTQSIEQWLFVNADAKTLYVLEPTGNYSDKLLHCLTKNNLPVSLVPPYQSKSFMQSQGISSKNDKQAADSLAKMGQSLELKLYRAPSEELKKRKQMLQTISALRKQEQMLLNQLHAMEQLVIIEDQSQQALQAVLQTVQSQLSHLEQQLQQQKQTEQYQNKKKLATSVVGIGSATADAILLATNCFEDFDSSAKVAKFLGLTPTSHYSGSSVNKKGHITKFGSNHVRALLFNCTRSAVRYNPACKELFIRLRKNGKPYKVAAIAVMHKLVRQVFACVKNEVEFDRKYKHFENKILTKI